mgnify:CR=1 FL=1
MGFWETAGKLAKSAANALDEKAHELQATQNVFRKQKQWRTQASYQIRWFFRIGQ